jgi:hypothetical protein
MLKYLDDQILSKKYIELRMCKERSNSKVSP